MRKFALVLLCCSAVALSGCKAKKMLDQASISKELDNKGTTDLMKETEKDQYTAPADGRLTDSQVQMYLKVRDKEKAIAQVAMKELQQHAKEADKEGNKSIGGMLEGFKAVGSWADVATADIRAAHELGYNTAEYRWVKERILEASGGVMQQKMQQATASMMDSSYQQMKKQYDEAKDETTKKALADMLANYEKSKQEMAQQQNVEPSVQYNMQLLSKYDNALNALTNELAKYETKEGEAQKGMNDFQQQLDKATAEAKKGAN